MVKQKLYKEDHHYMVVKIKLDIHNILIMIQELKQKLKLKLEL